MTLADPIRFTGNPLDRASEQRTDRDFLNARRQDPQTLLLPLYRGDPLLREGGAVFLSREAFAHIPPETPIVFLGLKDGRGYFAADFGAAAAAIDAPFADLGDYTPLREAAFSLDASDLAIIGEARWLLDWHRRHLHCAVCGAPTQMRDGGAKRQCGACAAEHFPRTDPVAIVLATHEDACLLGRGPHFPPGFVSALAGFVEACETPEECAVRELREEAGVTLTNVRYQFSQPWPFPSSLMMGFIADTTARTLTLDTKEIVEARWFEREEIRAILAGAKREDVRLPPRFTIARRLIERWAQ